MPLAMVETGQDVNVISLHGGFHVRKRLTDLGLAPGMTIRVVQRDPKGPIILAVKESRLAIGRGMAHKIMVEPC